MTRGATFKEIYSTRVSDDGERIVLWFEMTDGSIRSTYWTVESIVEHSGEIEEAKHAPAGLPLQ